MFVVEWDKPNEGWVTCNWGASTKIKETVRELRSAQRAAHEVGCEPKDFRIRKYVPEQEAKS